MQTVLPTIPDVERWNDTFARKHDIDDYYARSSFLIRWIEGRRLARIREMVAARASDRILEVGCGGGHILRMFPDCDLTGMDVSGEMLRKAARNLQGYRVELLRGELHELNLSESAFDTVICSEMLEHTVDPGAILEQIRRLVKPGGRVIITLPNDPLVNRLKAFVRGSGLTVLPTFRRISWGGDDNYHLHVWTVRQMHELLSSYFTIASTRFAPNRLLPVRCCFECERAG